MHQHFLQESVCEGDQNDLPFWFTNNQHYLSLFPSLLMGELRQLGLFGGCWERRVTIFSSGTNPNSEISHFRSGISGFTHLHLKFAFAAGRGRDIVVVGGAAGRGPLWALSEFSELEVCGLLSLGAL